MPSRRVVPQQSVSGAGASLPPSPSREARAYALRQCGLTFEQIGAELNVGRNQARTLALHWERRCELERRLRENPDDLMTIGDAGLLDRRIVNSLIYYYDVRTVPQMAALDDRDWMRLPLVGPALRAQAQAFLAQRAGEASKKDDPKK